jgi:hypothetical protein
MLFLMSGQILFEIGVDQDVAARRVDQVDGQIGGADIVEIPGDLKRWKLGVPIRIALRQHDGRGQEKQQRALVASSKRLASQHPDFYKPEYGYSLEVDPLAEQAGGDLKTPLLVLIGAVALVMLIACVNVSNLLLARAMSRKKEISIRAALGAARGRVIRQMLTESVLLASIAGVLGLALAMCGLLLYARFGPHELIRGTQPAINGWVMAFTMLISIAASVIFGLAPALETSRIDLNDALKESSRGVDRRAPVPAGIDGRDRGGGVAACC